MEVTALGAVSFLKLLECSFYRLVETGVIQKAGEDEYILGDVVEAYLRNQFDSEELTVGRTRLTTAQAEVTEQRRKLQCASAVMKIWSDTCQTQKYDCF